MKIKYQQSPKLILEFEPALRTIYYRGSRLRLPIPYQVWYFDFMFKKLRLYFLHNPLQSKYDPLYHPFLSNIANNCAICIHGWCGHYKEGINHPIAVSQSVISYFWQSGFNSDLTNDMSRKLDFWLFIQDQAKKNPEYWKEVPLIPVGIDLTIWLGVGEELDENFI